ncbi:choice-of-anchor D domain-containing protein [Dactylosporangium sp. NPDC000555]|uniref:choice-of-anchor D domain-containing protein n=1 Tax=Dactylosporangium sp. NPDC000555 TaxID=3154260 RepID=UPI003324F822
MRPRARTVALVAGATLAAAGVAVAVATPALAAATGGVGATLPYVEVQAEDSATNGTIIGPSAAYNTLAAEASRRKAVTLQGTGKYVEFTTPVATNSIVFRYSIPDTSNGSVYTAPLSLYINGTRSTNFTLTNAYSWYYGSYPFTNTPGSNAHHFYDEVNRLFPTTYPAGTKFRLQVDADSTASSYTIDFADFENVGPALSQPSGSVSVTSKGADPSGAADSTAAFNSAIAAAGPGGTVWIPEGTFRIPGSNPGCGMSCSHIIVNNVTIKGAGMWRSKVVGNAPGFYGGWAPNGGTNVHLSDFAIFGNVQERNDGDQVNGIGGALSNSTVDRLWIEHVKVGAWMDGPFNNLVFNQMRLRNYNADAVNFHNGVTNSKVTNSDVRNAGDDGLAMWAEHNANANNSFDHNTVQYPILANGIAIYGGRDNFVTDNRVIDAGLSQGGGIHVAQRFASTPLGRTDVLRNTIIRSGSLDPNWNFGVGALWFDARDGVMNGLTNVDNILIQQSPFEAIQFVSGSNISNVKINNATIQNTGTWAIQAQVGGSATISNSSATGVQAPAAIYNCGVGFTITDGGNNSGLSGSACQNISNPAFPPYLPDNGSSVNVSPNAVGFGSVVTGSTSAAQAVTVTNSGTGAAPVGTIAVSGDFAQTNTCGSSIAAGASCTVSVTFRPTVAGSSTGNLTVTASGVTNTVPLSGTGVAAGPIVSANPGSLSFGGTVVGSSAATQTVTLSNSGTAAAAVSGIATSGDFSQTNTCGSSIAVGGSCTVTVKFTPTASGARTGSLTVTSNANNSPTVVGLSGSGTGTDTNIALNRPVTASSQVNGTQAAATATDGSAATYWESVNNAFPQWIQVDLGAATSIGKVTLKLPADAAWATRTQTLSILGSTDGSNFSTLSASAGRTFNPATGNAVAITVPATSVRYVRVNVTANTGWPAAQLAEFEVYPSGGGTVDAPALSASPSSLTFASQALNTTSASQAVTITNTGTAAASVSGVTTSGEFSQTNNCGSVAVGASCVVNVSFRPTASGSRTGTLTVTSNASNSPTTVALSGTGAGATSTNLAAGKPTSESSHNLGFVSGNVTDADQNTYWESANNAFPQWVQVDLGSAQSASRIVLQLPASWGARTQRIQVQGSTNGSAFTEIKAAADYSFAPGAGNTVTITFGATSQRYFRLTFLSNTGWPAGQLSTLQVWNI